jgi:hypothetical protein
MKRIAIAVVALSTLAAFGCKKDEPKNPDKSDDTVAKPVEAQREEVAAEPAAAEPAAAEPAEDEQKGPTGVAECDDLIEKYTMCVGEKAPEDAREKTLADFNVHVEAWKKDAVDESKRKQLAEGCSAQAESLKQSTEAWGCVW